MAETTKGTPRYRFGEGVFSATGVNALFVILEDIFGFQTSDWWWYAIRLAVVIAFSACLVAWLGYVVRDKRRGYRDTLEEATPHNA